MLNDALEFAKRGIAVFPLTPLSKKPLFLPGIEKGKGGVHLATTNLDQIRKWWRQEPKANIGIALGKISGIVAIDLDGNHGATEEDFKRFPRTVTTKTKNGFHLVYKYPNAGVEPHVVFASPSGDAAGAAYLRSDGQYVVAAGSTVLHDDGTEWDYEFLCDEGGERDFVSCNLAELPDFCIGNKSGGHQEGNPATNGYPPNTRHDMFLRTATGMWSDGATVAQIRLKLFKRNAEECKPPKPLDEMEKEVEDILKWLVTNVPKKAGPTNTGAPAVRPASSPSYVAGTSATTGTENKAEPAAVSRVSDAADPAINKEALVCDGEIICLGYRGQEYFYTSIENKNVIPLSGSSHTQNNLLQLMPLAFWLDKYPSKQAGVNWSAASSDLMAGCRAVGYFQEDKIRGVGCWLRDDGSLIIHAGDRLIHNENDYHLGDLDDGYIYQLGARHEIHPNPLSVEECATLVRACAAPKWRASGYGALLAGGLGVLRLCGALRWRPMFWLTGASGSGKSTLMEQIVKPIAGEWATYAQGQATEAGIRQQLKCSSRPVIFDEAETTDPKSGDRIKRVVELARQGSSMSGGRIMKGTPHGQVLSFTVNSSFLMSSIRVNLTEEADINRFCLLELDRPDPAAWPAIAAAMAEIDEEYGDRLFARMVRNWGQLERNRQVFEAAIVSNGEDRRRAQQYSIILASYWLLTSDDTVTHQQAADLSRGLVQHQRLEMEQDKDEVLASDRILQHRHKLGDDIISIQKLITLAQSDNCYNEALGLYGLAIHDNALCIHTSHSALADIYKNSKWAGNWSGALVRVTGAVRRKAYIGGKQQRCVSIPLSVLLSCG